MREDILVLLDRKLALLLKPKINDIGREFFTVIQSLKPDEYGKVPAVLEEYSSSVGKWINAFFEDAKEVTIQVLTSMDAPLTEDVVKEVIKIIKKNIQDEVFVKRFDAVLDSAIRHFRGFGVNGQLQTRSIDLHRSSVVVTTHNLPTRNILAIENELKMFALAQKKGTVCSVVPIEAITEKKRVQCMETIFLSYSWKNKKVADFVEASFSGSGVEIVRDERSVSYTKSIKEFMRGVRGTDYSLLLITEDYLKSVNCMFEVLEIVKDEKFCERILPIVHADTNIFTLEGRLIYTQFWQSELDRLTRHLQTTNPINVPSEYVELRRIEDVLRTVSQFLNAIVDMKCIVFTKQINDTDIQIIKARIGMFEDETQIFYILSKTKTILYDLNTFVWWASERNGYTDTLANAGKYTVEEVKEIVHPFSEDIPYTKMVAIPVAVARRIFQSHEIIPRNAKFLDSLYCNAAHLIGDLHWNLPEIMF